MFAWGRELFCRAIFARASKIEEVLGAAGAGFDICAGLSPRVC